MVGKRGPLPKSKSELNATGSSRAKNATDMERPQSGKGTQEPPEYLNEDECKIWARLLPKALEMKTYKNADHDSFGQLCRALNTLLSVQKKLIETGFVVEVNYEDKSGQVKTFKESPLFSTEKRCILNYNTFAAQFGFNPMARTRLQINPFQKGGPIEATPEPIGPGPQEPTDDKSSKILEMMNIKRTG